MDIFTMREIPSEFNHYTRSKEVDYLADYLIPNHLIGSRAKLVLHVNSCGVYFIMSIKIENGERDNSVLATEDGLAKVSAFLNLVGYGMPEVSNG